MPFNPHSDSIYVKPIEGSLRRLSEGTELRMAVQSFAEYLEPTRHQLIVQIRQTDTTARRKMGPWRRANVDSGMIWEIKTDERGSQHYVEVVPLSASLIPIIREFEHEGQIYQNRLREEQKIWERPSRREREI